MLAREIIYRFAEIILSKEIISMKDKTVKSILSAIMTFVMVSTLFPVTLPADSTASSGAIKYLSRGLDGNDAVMYLGQDNG